MALKSALLGASIDKAGIDNVSALAIVFKTDGEESKAATLRSVFDPSRRLYEVNMKSVIIPIGAGLIISVAGYIYNQRKISSWMQERRIDKLPKRPDDICGVCGAKMKERYISTGEMAGKRVMVCTRWPDCRKVDWNGAK